MRGDMDCQAKPGTSSVTFFDLLHPIIIL